MVWVLHVCVSQLCVYVGVVCVSVSSCFGCYVCGGVEHVSVSSWYGCYVHVSRFVCFSMNCYV